MTARNRKASSHFLPGVLTGLQLIKTLYWFRGVDLSQPLPIINYDYILYYARALRAHEFLSASGRIWGYDPFQMAGYVAGPFEVGTHLFSLVTHLAAPLVPIHRTLLAVEFLTILVFPFFLYWAARLFGASKTQAWTAFGFVVFCFGGIERLTHEVVFAGLWGFQVACFLALCQTGLLWKFFETRKSGWFLLTVLASAVLFQIHGAALLLVVPSNLILYGLRFKSLPVRWHRLLFAGGFAVLAANWFWVRPFLHFRQWLIEVPYLSTWGWAQINHYFGPFQYTLKDWFNVLFNWVCILLAGHTLKTWRSKKNGSFPLFAGWGAWIFLVAFFGSRIPGLRSVQPYRAIILFWLGVWMLAGFAVPKAVWRVPVRRRGLWLLLAILGFYHFPVRSALPLNALQNSFPLHIQNLLDYLGRLDPRQGRILIGSTETVGTHELDLVPHLTGLSLLGGPNPGVFTMGAYTLFSESSFAGGGMRKTPVIFDRLLSSYSEKEFARMLNLYNVCLVGTSSAKSNAVFRSFPHLLEPAESVGRLDFFRVKQPTRWLLSGAGRVRFGFDEINVENAGKGEIILKFHYIDTFKTEPPVPIEPVLIGDDPVPFIRLQNEAGRSSIRIYNAGLE